MNKFVVYLIVLSSALSCAVNSAPLFRSGRDWLDSLREVRDLFFFFTEVQLPCCGRCNSVLLRPDNSMHKLKGFLVLSRYD